MVEESSLSSSIVCQVIGTLVAMYLGVAWAPIHGYGQVRVFVQRGENVLYEDERHGLGRVWAWVCDELEGRHRVRENVDFVAGRRVVGHIADVFAGQDESDHFSIEGCGLASTPDRQLLFSILYP